MGLVIEEEDVIRKIVDKIVLGLKGDKRKKEKKKWRV